MSLLLDSYSEANQDTGNQQYAANSTASAQSFTTPNDGNTYELTSVKFYLKKTGAPTGNAVAKLYAHSGTYGSTSLPTGASLATSNNLDVTTLTTTYQLVEFTFPTPVLLTPNTHYVISYEHSGVDASNFTWCGADSISPTASGNFSYFASSVWNVFAAWDACFYVYGRQVLGFGAEVDGFSAGAQPTLTLATTVAGSNPVGTVLASHDGSTTCNITGITWNGVAMTKVNDKGNTSSNSNISLWQVANPTTGNVVISVSPNRQLYGITLYHTYARQTGLADANNTATDSVSPYSISTTTVTDKSWLICAARGGNTLNASTNITVRGAPFATIKIGDTNGAISPSGATTQEWTEGGANAETALLTVSVAPLGTFIPAFNKIISQAVNRAATY